MEKINFNSFNDFYLEHNQKILNQINLTLSSGEYIRGKENLILEKHMRSICKRNYAVTTSSCTDALFFALKSIGIKKGDEVILPAFSYIASLSPILMCEATPVFTDVQKDNLMIDSNEVKKAISQKTKAIIVVQLFGSCLEYENLKNLSKKHKITLIEDSAQALGARVNNRPAGSIGDISCFSFDPTKIISAFGTGGCILTDQKEIFDNIKKLIHHGKNATGEYELIGYNSKISELNVKLINYQISFLDSIVKRYLLIAQKYYKLLQDNPNIQFIKTSKFTNSTFHKFVIMANNRDALKDFLLKKRVPTRVHYKPLLHEHKLLIKKPFRKLETPIADQAKELVLSLPVHPYLKDKQIKYICRCINEFYKI